MRGRRRTEAARTRRLLPKGRETGRRGADAPDDHLGRPGGPIVGEEGWGGAVRVRTRVRPGARRIGYGKEMARRRRGDAKIEPELAGCGDARENRLGGAERRRDGVVAVGLGPVAPDAFIPRSPSPWVSRRVTPPGSRFDRASLEPSPSFQFDGRTGTAHAARCGSSPAPLSRPAHCFPRSLSGRDCTFTAAPPAG